MRTTYTCDAANHLVTAKDNAGTTTFTFDTNGNQLTEKVASGGITTNTWDYENRLARVMLPSGVRNTFMYIADGLRVQKQDSSGTLKAIWDGQKILAEADGSDVVQVVYTLSAGVHGDLVSQRRSGATQYFHFDPLGSTDRLTDAASSLTDSYLYRAFGSAVATSGTTANPFRYGGRNGYYVHHDQELYYIRARILAVGIGRFMSRDPRGYTRGRGWGMRILRDEATGMPIVGVTP